MDATSFASTATSTSALGSSRIILTNLLTGIVVEPSFEISASTVPLTPTSRSVVVRRKAPPVASIKTFDRMGRVVLVLTTC